jgi:hypothetical protein
MFGMYLQILYSEVALVPLMYSQQAFPVNPLAKQGNNADQKMTATYGLKSSDSLAYYDPGTSCWKTYQAYLPFIEEENSESSSVTWPRSGMTQNGKLYQRQPSVRPISANGYGLLPTPKKSMGDKGWGITLKGKQRYSKQVQERAMSFGYKPPIALVEWMMGFPADFIRGLSAHLEIALSHKSLSTSETASSEQKAT